MLTETKNMCFVTEPCIEKRYIKTDLYYHKYVKKQGAINVVHLPAVLRCTVLRMFHTRRNVPRILF